MKTTFTPHLRISPYKGSVATVQIQMPFHAVGRSFRPMGLEKYNADVGTGPKAVISVVQRFGKGRGIVISLVH